MRDTQTTRPATNSKIWLTHLRAWQNSGLTRAEYCRRNNLSYDALTYWKRKAERQKKTATNFVSVPAIRITQGITADNSSAALKIALGNGIKVEIHDGFTPATLSRIVSTLKAY